MTSLSVPVPTSFRETDDHFMTVVVGAPQFEFLNQMGLTYTVTLDMMMDSLRSGIDTVASRAKNPEAQLLFEKSRKEVDAAYELYRENKLTEAQQRMFEGLHLFRQAGKLRTNRGRTTNTN